MLISFGEFDDRVWDSVGLRCLVRFEFLDGFVDEVVGDIRK